MSLALADPAVPPPAHQVPGTLALIVRRWSPAEWLLGAALAVLVVFSAGFFTVSAVISARDPDYFERRLLAGAVVAAPALDPITTGAVEAGAQELAEGDAIPVPAVVPARAPTPADYQIVMIFEGEALLATGAELRRVRVGSSAPGLGEILSIEASEGGGSVRTEKATLRTVAQ